MVVVDGYCARLRAALGRLPAGQREDFVQEMRSHVLERAREEEPLTRDGLAGILERLGDPRELAAAYELDALLDRAEGSRSPGLLLRASLRWARTGLAGLGVFVLTTAGYGCALVCYVCAVLEPFFPTRFGLWQGVGSRLTFGFWSGRLGDEVYGIAVQPGSFVLGTLGPAEGPLRDVLGMWIVPIGLVLGAALGLGTTFASRSLIRRFRSTADTARDAPAVGPTPPGTPA
jgi:uncharacterized membrane protein